MAIPGNLMPLTCDIYRPFGAAAPIYTNVPCRLAADFVRGGRAASLRWTHVLYFAPGMDVRDGCTRSAGSNNLSYADGDEVRVAGSGGPVRFVVIWVDDGDPGTPHAFRRAYVMRHPS